VRRGGEDFIALGETLDALAHLQDNPRDIQSEDPGEAISNDSPLGTFADLPIHRVYRTCAHVDEEIIRPDNGIGCLLDAEVFWGAILIKNYCFHVISLIVQAGKYYKIHQYQKHYTMLVNPPPRLKEQE